MIVIPFFRAARVARPSFTKLAGAPDAAKAGYAKNWPSLFAAE
jgi:hypothetical protein